jgi:hypothetical protein
MGLAKMESDSKVMSWRLYKMILRMLVKRALATNLMLI